ncbi:cytosolic protein [Bacillus sp. 31A1R]|uniref:Cytosolic protein n=1 Tax=Robertmurraya mangrovi TaxID=3098077 RepID=A0ABU5IY83_9BACI|nr:cytosolic protein [Bacillus sp. 31A1R]MDZ5472129.1 cytosolic protein [Bacillus sp. 31A1R]
MSEDKEVYTDFTNVETQRKFLVPEQTPEGPYGAPRGKDTPVQGKTPWLEGQQYYSAFTYENRTLHQNMPRQMEGSHPTHDDPNKETEPPYDHGQTADDK